MKFAKGCTRVRTPEGLLKFLRKKLPTPFPVKMEWRERLDGKAVIASTELKTPEGEQPYFLLLLSRNLLRYAPRWAMIDTVVHEYAHCLAWTDVHRNLKDHGSLWAIAHGMAYQIYIGEL